MNMKLATRASGVLAATVMQAFEIFLYDNDNYFRQSVAYSSVRKHVLPGYAFN
jgi:hypothetical protein